MKISTISSTDARPCAKCGKVTGTYKSHQQTNIEIKVPLCNTDKRRCYHEVNVNDIAAIAIKLVKREINA